MIRVIAILVLTLMASSLASVFKDGADGQDTQSDPDEKRDADAEP